MTRWLWSHGIAWVDVAIVVAVGAVGTVAGLLGWWLA